MKLFLDAHISARRIAAPLRDRGHNVRAADQERELDSLGDEDLLAIAASERRILVTFDVHDFPAITRRWAEAGRAHAGCAIVVGIDHGELNVTLTAITAGFTAPSATRLGMTSRSSSPAPAPSRSRAACVPVRGMLTSSSRSA